MSGNFPNVKALRARHTGWDKPTTENLKDIGAIEYFWRNLFEAIFYPNQDKWQEHWQQLHDLILERCPDNDERTTTLVYLEKVKRSLKTEEDWKKHWKGVLIYLENTRDWARKSIIRAWSSIVGGVCSCWGFSSFSTSNGLTNKTIRIQQIKSWKTEEVRLLESMPKTTKKHTGYHLWSFVSQPSTFKVKSSP